MNPGGFGSIALVGLGGGLGAIARHLLGNAILLWPASTRFPFPTLIINVMGCLVIGVLAGVAERGEILGSASRLLLFTGVLGGFTTFSALGLDAIGLLRRGEVGLAVLYGSGSVVLGIAAVWLGLRAVALFIR